MNENLIENAMKQLKDLKAQTVALQKQLKNVFDRVGKRKNEPALAVPAKKIKTENQEELTIEEWSNEQPEYTLSKWQALFLSDKEPEYTINGWANYFGLSQKGAGSVPALRKELQEATQNKPKYISTKFENKDLSYFINLSDSKKVESVTKNYLTFETTAVIRNIEEVDRPDLLIDKIFEVIVRAALKNCKKQPDLLNLQLYGEGMQTPYYVPLRSMEMNNPTTFSALFNELAQSEKLASIFNSKLLVKVCAAWSPSGGYCNENHQSHVVPCSAKNTWCLARSIVYGINAIHKNNKQFNKFIHKELEKETEKLMMRAGLSLNKKLYTLLDLEKIQEIVTCRIIVFDQYRSIIYKGNSSNQETITLSLIKNHFDLIPNVNVFLKCHKFCFECEKPVTRIYHNSECAKCCRSCLRFGKEYPCKLNTGEKPLSCGDCGFWFNNEECFDHHKKTKTGQRKHRSLCEERYFCIKCESIIQYRGKKYDHKCDTFQPKDSECGRCKEDHKEGQKYCYIQPIVHNGNPPVRYIYCDCETWVKNNEHICNLICATVLCSACSDAKIIPESEERVSNCVCFAKQRKLIFKKFVKSDSDPVTKFLKFLLVSPEKMPPTIIIAHNAGKFDYHLFINPLLEHGIRPNLTCVGFKIYRMDIKYHGNIFTFKDSYNFMMLPLSALPKTFDFDTQKGYFPHKFNLPENLFKMMSHLPEIQYYEPQNMKSEEREQFLIWYKEHYNDEFCLREVLIDYCERDVKVMQLACQSFREIMIKATDVDPFFYASTAAKFAMHVFRTNFLKYDQMINAPEKGFREAPSKASEKALKFIKFYGKLKNLRIRDASYKDGEYKIPNTNYFVDGVVLNKNGTPKTAIEYLGCYYHGCPYCYPKHGTILNEGKTSLELFTSTMHRIYTIRNIIPVKFFWECQADKYIKATKDHLELYKTIKVAPKMELRRDALRGGRTENFKFSYTCKKDEEIVSLDIISLYPATQKHNPFPIKTPEVLTADMIKCKFPWDSPADNIYKGFLLVEILPPQKLKRPVLPYKTKNGYIVYTLCSKCADQNLPKCNHNDNERSWIAGFTHAELNLALEKSYKVIQVFEIWNYKNWSNDIFAKYVNTFLKMKQENSGWGNIEEKDRAKFIEEYEKKEKVVLDPDAITVNRGKAACAKLMLNSLWGKMCQRAELSKVIYTNSYSSFWREMSNCKQEVLDLTKISETIDRLVVKDKPEFQKEPITNNLPIACFVTSYARIALYRFMDQIDPDRILYIDTDSIFYILKKGEKKIKEGLYLGSMKRDLVEYRIYAFFAAGCKNYGYRYHLKNNKSVKKDTIKVRGFALTFNAKTQLTYKKMHRATMDKIRNKKPEDINIPYFSIQRSKNNVLKNKTIIKKWRPVFTKGTVKELLIRPFGYKKY